MWDPTDHYLCGGRCDAAVSADSGRLQLVGGVSRGCLPVLTRLSCEPAPSWRRMDFIPIGGKEIESGFVLSLILEMIYISGPVLRWPQASCRQNNSPHNVRQ